MSEQPYLGKDYEPPRDENIEKAIVFWEEMKLAQKRASHDTKTAHAAVILHMLNAGIEIYPWVNPNTGKKRAISIVREPKAKETRAPRGNRTGGDAEIGEGDETREKKRERKKRREEEKVEVRRVPRSTVVDEVDPFAATRDAMASSSSSSSSISATTKHDKPSRARGKPAKPKGKRN